MDSDRLQFGNRVAFLLSAAFAIRFRKAASMPLQHLHEYEEQRAPLRTGAPAETMQAVLHEAALDAPRYDMATVKQIIALAEQIQSHHRQTLTLADIEALGHEVGVEPKFIRRALAQMVNSAADPATPFTPFALSRENQAVAALRALKAQTFSFLLTLTKQQLRLLSVPVGLYLLVLPLMVEYTNLAQSPNDSFAILMYVFVPAALSLYLGGKERSYRFGALIGALTGFLAVVSLDVLNWILHHFRMSASETLLVVAIWIGAGVLLGVSGAAATKFIHWLSSLSSKQRVRAE